MAQELEFKYGLKDQARFDALTQALMAQYPGHWAPVRMESVYYDTPDRRLSARRWTLRIRRENDLRVLTLKTPGAGRARGEWEVPGGTLPQGLEDLIRAGAPQALRALCGTALAPVCGAKFCRRKRLLEIPGAVLELALDQGKLLGGDREQPIWELEAELKAGSGEALALWCEALAERYGLQEEPQSKFQRASCLEGGSHG